MAHLILAWSSFTSEGRQNSLGATHQPHSLFTGQPDLSRAHPIEMFAHTSARFLDLSKLPLPLPEHHTTNSTSNQPSYSVQPTTIPKQFNNHPTQLKTKTKPNSQTMASNTLTDNDRKLLAAAWQCFETQPKVRNSLPLTTQPNPTRKPPLHIKPRTKPHH